MRINIWKISTSILLIISIVLIGYLVNKHYLKSDSNYDALHVENETNQSEPSDDNLYTDSNDIELLTPTSIDSEYDGRKQVINSNAELTNLNDEFAIIWEEKVQIYNKRIELYYCSNGDNVMSDEIAASQEAWEKYYQNQMDNYEKIILSEYTSGSIVPVKLSEFKLNLFRHRAIVLYSICQDLMIDVIMNENTIDGSMSSDSDG